MQYFVRLLVVPFLVAGMFCLLLPTLRSGSQAFDAMVVVIGLPFAVTFFSQLHRIDVERRLALLEKELRQLDLRQARESTAA